jgi:alpha-tubulin suppressor-like RCC1 family protein
VRCWGLNTIGQLGLGNTETIGDDELPSVAADVPLPRPASQLSVGDQHTCAVLADNAVRCWGMNMDGRLGYANTNNIGDDEFPTDPVDVGGMVDQVEAGAFHSCARLGNSVRCWGLGSLGRLGYGNVITIGDNEIPALAGEVDVGGPTVLLSAGGAHTCAIALVGSIRCWGRNEQGQLGYGNTNNIGDNEVPASAGNVANIPMGLPLNAKVEQLSHGVTHTCALFESGDVLCWGSALFGEIGTGSTNFLGDDELPASASPIDLPGPAIAVSAGGAHSCALLENGEVHCWGANTFGELGYGNTSAVGDDESPSEAGPVQIGAPAIQIEAGFFHTCAVTNTNEVRCWGNNDGGQLGLGNTSRIGDDEIPNSVPTIELFPTRP